MSERVQPSVAACVSSVHPCEPPRIWSACFGSAGGTPVCTHSDLHDGISGSVGTQTRRAWVPTRGPPNDADNYAGEIVGDYAGIMRAPVWWSSKT